MWVEAPKCRRLSNVVQKAEQRHRALTRPDPPTPLRGVNCPLTMCTRSSIPNSFAPDSLRITPRHTMAPNPDAPTELGVNAHVWVTTDARAVTEPTLSPEGLTKECRTKNAPADSFSPPHKTGTNISPRRRRAQADPVWTILFRAKSSG